MKNNHPLPKIAIISPMVMPIPDVVGAAVEGLIEIIIEENEKHHLLDIDLYTIEAPENTNTTYKHTNLIKIPRRKVRSTLYRYGEKIFRTIFKTKHHLYNGINNKVSNLVAKTTYNAIIIENNMYAGTKIATKIKDTTPLIYHAHNTLTKKGGDKPPKSYKKLANSLNHLIAISDFIKAEYNKVAKVPTTILYNAVDDHYTEKNNLRTKYRLKKDHIIIGFSGRISPEKGILELIKAFNKLDNQNNNTKLLIAGGKWQGHINSNTYINSLEKAATKNPENIIFTGNIPHKNISTFYNTVDIMVIPSKWEEPLSCSALEAMSMGKTIIATKSGGMPEGLGDAAIYVKNDQNLTQNLHKTLQDLIDNPAKIHKFSQAARHRYTTHKEFHRDTYYQNFVKIINNTLEKAN